VTAIALAGRVALVTGAVRRVGRAIATELAAKGMRLALHYHASAGDAEALRATLTSTGTDVRLFRADLRELGAPERLVGDVVASYGELGVLVNSAAVMQRTPLGEVTVADWDSMFALNLRAPFFLAQAAAPHLARAAGAIVNVSDLAAFETWPAYVPHGITKAGVVQMTRALARALAPAVRVNGVAPGVVLLPEGWSDADAARLAATTPMRRNGTPEDVAHAVRYLLEAPFVTGQTIVVDGGRNVRT